MKPLEELERGAKTIDAKDIEVTETWIALIGVIIDRRKELHLTQRKLAALAGIPQSTLARIEACIVKPNIDTMLKIMKPLGLTLAATEI